LEYVSFGPLVPYQPYIFYLQVKRNWTTPFWLHPILNPYGHQIVTASGSGEDSPTVDDNRNAREDSGEDNGPTATEPKLAVEYRKWSRKRVREHTSTIRDFCDGLDYQLQSEESRSPDELEKLERNLILAACCPSRECRMNPSRGNLEDRHGQHGRGRQQGPTTAPPAIASPYDFWP
jgi:hypothetical protein